ncbi:MAG: heme-binding protein [Herminiimonas sp.]|nr:heme-binding protein [Herminiimonas sp.]
MNVTLLGVRLLAAIGCSLALQMPALAKADPAKVLRVSFEATEDGFDLLHTSNLYSIWMAEAIFESLLQYDYLARPAKVIAGTAEAMPEVSDDGKTYLFRIKKGIYFTPDPAFKGVRRELVASDYAYVIKRHMDPKSRSVQSGTFEGKIAGLDALVAEAKKSGRFDYDAPVAGLDTPDRYTLRIRLNNPDPTLQYHLASPVTAALAREVVETYGEDIGRHPVGTGAYLMKQYVPRSKIILEANPDYRGFKWDFKSTGDAWDDQIVRDMKGKDMPQVGRVEISIIEEEQSRFLAFDSGQLDFEQLSDPAAPKVLNGDKLKPEFTARGIRLYRFTMPANTYTYFNFKDPVVGGYTKDKIALRRAISMAYDPKQEIVQVRYGQAVKAQSVIPPGVSGHDPAYRTSIGHDPVLAAKLLDRFGYKKGPDGYRTLPDGKPLTIRIHSAPKTRDIAKMEIWKRSLDAIGVRAEFPVSGFADNLKAAYRCELMMFGLGGTASIPDASDFFENFYGPNASQGNFGCYRSAVFDNAYKKSRLMADSPERQELYRIMQRQMEADTVQSLELWRVRNWLIQPWVKGYKTHPILHGDWQYLDVEKR